MSEILLKLNGSSLAETGYVGWKPLPLTVFRLVPSWEKLYLKCRSKEGSTTKVVFYEEFENSPQGEIVVDFRDNDQVTVYVSGLFQPGLPHNGASPDGKDVIIEVWDEQQIVGTLEVMVRVRRNANELNDKARMDFLNALAKLNGIKVDDEDTPGAGKGIYCTDFIEMHIAGATNNEHGDAMFLPWHRLYILDLERQLQNINPAVTLPYWRFDQAAPYVFSPYFMGAMREIPRNTEEPGGDFDQGGTHTPLAGFDAGNPLSRWKVKEVSGIPRTARFNPANAAANGVDDFGLLNEEETFALGDIFGPKQTAFSAMEGTPHGAAHVSFNGYINFVPVAPKDPLFFLLHCNVDRLWAKWQFIYERSRVRDVSSYPYQHMGDGDPWKIVDAKQWPWDGSTSFPGHLNPPGTRKFNFTRSADGKNFPDNVPMIADAIDAFGYHDPESYLGYEYDDVPYSWFSKTALAADISFLNDTLMDSSEYRKRLFSHIEGAATSGDSGGERLTEIGKSPEKIKKLLETLADESLPDTTRQQALTTLNVISVFSPVLSSMMDAYINVLRGMMDTSDRAIRVQAVGTLAAMKDTVVQERLMEELKSDMPEEDKTVPTHDAIAMLGFDEKALDYDVLRHIAQKPPTPQSLMAAVRYLPGDEASLGILTAIMEDDSKPLAIRAIIPELINNTYPEAFLEASDRIMAEKGVADKIIPYLVNGIKGIQKKYLQSGDVETARQRFIMEVKNKLDEYQGDKNDLLTEDKDD